MKMSLRTYVYNYIWHIFSEKQMASLYGSRDIGFGAQFVNLT